MHLTAANTGITAVIAADGSVLAQLPQYSEARLDAEARGRSGTTPYARFRDAPVLALCLALFLGFTLRLGSR
jgi:apolipoprotein N-acyltransferase